MSRNEWLAWALMVILAAVMLWLLPACAAPERRPPIDYYREQYGFPTSS
jgi:hypothetical protein